MERKFLLLPGCVHVLLERGRVPTDIVPVLADAILLAKKERRNGLLVVSGLDDPTTAGSLSDAFQTMMAAGAPPPSRFAFVALMYSQYEVYHFAEHLAPKYSMQAKVFADVVEAKIWLGAMAANQPPPSAGTRTAQHEPFPETEHTERSQPSACAIRSAS